MKRFIAIVLALVMALSVASMVACSKGGNEGNTPAPGDTTAPTDTTAPAPADFKVGVILIGDENEGYTYAHIEGVEAAKAACGLTDDQVIYKYSRMNPATLPRSTSSSRAARSSSPTPSATRAI